jgi:hypothetical protein
MSMNKVRERQARKFQAELATLLEKYQVSINSVVGEGSDSHRLYDKKIEFAPIDQRWKIWVYGNKVVSSNLQKLTENPVTNHV